MSSVRRTYAAQQYDQLGNLPIDQLDNPIGAEILTNEARNARTVLGKNKLNYRVADSAVNPRGSKQTIWSTEGYSYRGVNIPALTNAQKAASGSVATNINLAVCPDGSAIPVAFSIPTTLDLSPYHLLQLFLVLTSFTAGTSPSIAFNLSFADDTATPNTLAIWNPAAATAAASYLVQVSAGLTVPPASAPTGYANAAIPSGWTAYSIPLAPVPNGSFAWTVTGAPTAVAWTAWLYGHY